MSGICDTCRRTTCEYRADDIVACGLPKTETNWERLFGTPERAARTLIKVRKECEDVGTCYPNCPFCNAPACPSGAEPRDYDALLEWLRGDAE